MKLKKKGKVVYIVGAVGVIVFAMGVLLLTLNSPVESSGIKPIIVQKTEKAGIPMRIKIPVIRIDTVIEHVGLTPQDSVGVPKKPTNVAWFKLGPRPGDEGSSVIVGHYGWQNRKPAAFDKLSKLRKGDKIYIEDDKGEVVTFVVRESKRYAWDADVPEVFEVGDEKSHLNLITCEGVWSRLLSSYSRRLVVFADRE